MNNKLRHLEVGLGKHEWVGWSKTAIFCVTQLCSGPLSSDALCYVYPLDLHKVVVQWFWYNLIVFI